MKIKTQLKTDQVDYGSLDEAKNKFIAASKRTLDFAGSYGSVLTKGLGASANIFSLDLNALRRMNGENLFLTLISEGLGTADDARPQDLNNEELTRFWWNIGLKAVSCLTNDAASAGLQSILVSLYLPSSTPDTVFTQSFLEGFLDGFVEGCRKVGCVYISGETPQLKSKIYPGVLDIAGAVVGVAKPGVLPVTGEQLEAGDTIVFVESSGPHENGFTPLRALAEKLPQGYRTRLPSRTEFWEATNKGSYLYTGIIQEMLYQKVPITSIENVSGHGWQKIMRSSKKLQYFIEEVFEVPEIFTFVKEQQQLSHKEMLEIFNYGVGLVLFIKGEDNAKKGIEIVKEMGFNAIRAGKVFESKIREVRITPFDVVLSGEEFTLSKGNV
jgi:phosphoribosylformylglycinamidine cyclo-ligase